MSEIVQQKVYVTQGNKVVQKNVLDLSPAENQKISEEMDTFLHVARQLNPDFNDEDMQGIIERVDASGRAADDVMSYTFAHNEIRREARQRMEDEIKAREQASQSVAREAQLQAEREEYLRPADRAEVARQPKNQNLPDQPASPVPPREYTDSEIDKMSCDDMIKNGVASRRRTIEDLQGSSGQFFRPETRPERAAEYRKRKDLMKPLAEILGQKPRSRKIKFSPEEMAARAYRQGVVAQNESERRKLAADLERVREEQEEKRHNAKKQRRS
jgi:hypothetical protein